MIFFHRDIFWDVDVVTYMRYMSAIKKVGAEIEKVMVNGRFKNAATLEQIENIIQKIDSYKGKYRCGKKTLEEVKNRLVEYLA